MRYRIVEVQGGPPGPRGIVEFRAPLAENQEWEIVEWTGEVMADLLRIYKGDARQILGYFKRTGRYLLEPIGAGHGA